MPRPGTQCAARARTLLLALALAATSTPLRAQAPARIAPGFDVDLFRAIVSAERGRNVFVSPYSAFTALAMAYEGAAGDTREAIGRALVGPASAPAELDRLVAARSRRLAGDRETTLLVASSLWTRADAPIEPGYQRAMQSAFGAEVAAVDLASPRTVARINGWASRATRGRIGALLSAPLPKTTVAVLLNAVYFKGKWVDAFATASTAPRPFTLGDGQVVQRPAMARVGAYAVRREGAVQMIRLPYRGRRFSMYVVLPDSGVSTETAMRTLDAAHMAAWLSELRPTEVALQLPRFRLEYDVDLMPSLTALGMGVAFDCGRADFGRMLPPRYLALHRACIGAARQKTFVDVSEEGTEAAAVTGIVTRVDSAPPPPVPFIVDRPFLFLIREDVTGTILFLGRIADPG